MSGQHRAPAALFPRNLLVQIGQEAGLQSRSGQFAEETMSRLCRDSMSGSRDLRFSQRWLWLFRSPWRVICQKAVHRRSIWHVGSNRGAPAVLARLLCSDRTINGTVSRQRAEGITGLQPLPGQRSLECSYFCFREQYLSAECWMIRIRFLQGMWYFVGCVQHPINQPPLWLRQVSWQVANHRRKRSARSEMMRSFSTLLFF